MPPSYKLTYFDVPGMAETCRYLFSYGGIEFEDVRIKREDWLKQKDSTSKFVLYFQYTNFQTPGAPFGVLPILEHNGKIVGQSLAITRYLAKKVKLVGDNDWENLEIDAIVDTINDMRPSNTCCILVGFFFLILFVELAPIFMEQDETKKKTLVETVKNDVFGVYLPRLEAAVQKNKGYLVLGRVKFEKRSQILNNVFVFS